MAKHTQASYVEAVYYRLSKGKSQPDAGIWRAAIAAKIHLAERQLAEKVAESPDYSYLTKDYTVAIASGTASLATETDILYEYVWRVLDASSVRWHRLPYRSYLDSPRQSWKTYYAIESNAIFAKKGDLTTPTNQSITVTASFIGTLHASVAASTTIPEQLNGVLETIGESLFVQTSVGQ